MGYFLILVTALLNVSKGGFSKKVSTHLSCLAENINLCFLRNMICVVIGFFVLFFSRTSFCMPTVGWLICAFSGVCMSVNYIVWLMALKSDSYMLASTVNSSSFIVAAVCGIFLFNEKITVFKGISFILILVAVFFMLRYQTKKFKAPHLYDIVVLCLVFVTAGGNSVCQKLFTHHLDGFSTNVFTFYTFVFSCILLLAVRPFLRCTEKCAAQAKKMLSLSPFIAFMGIALYGATFCQTTATNYVDTIVLYPLSNSLSLVFASLMAWIFFKEKPSRDSIIGSAFVLCALILSKY